MPRASRYRGSTAERKPTGSTPKSLKRGFLGWLRGANRRHCSMARVPTIAEEDAKRPNRERDGLVGERTRIVNRIKCSRAGLGAGSGCEDWPNSLLEEAVERTRLSNGQIPC